MKNNEVIDLMKINIDKMNFQQNMCFQMKNWTIVITIAILSVAWKIDFSNKGLIYIIIVPILIHLPLILFHYFFKLKTKDWMCYFIVFRERTKLLEKIIIENIDIEKDGLKNEVYFKYQDGNLPEKDIDRSLIIKDFRNEVKDKFFIYLMIITFFSLIGLIFYAAK